MIALLAELGIDAARICQIPGLSPATLAAILAETGDLRQYESSSSVVKHAGMSPARNESAAASAARRRSPAGAGPRCGWPPGGPPGRCCGTATCSPPSTPP